MKCIVFLFIVISLSSTCANVEEKILSPICLVNFDDHEKPCAFFQERSIEKLEEDKWTEQSINKTTYGYQYTNITIVYPRKTLMDPLLVMIRLNNKFPLPDKTWEIQPINKEYHEKALLITIAYAPIEANYTRYEIRRIVNPARLLEDPACNKSETIQDCKSLRSSKLLMRKSSGNTLRLSMAIRRPRRSLTVEILSAQCNITCRGDMNSCSDVEIKNMIWESPSEELIIYNTNNNSSPVYYCARISPAFHECCMIYTETVLLNPDQRDLSVTFSQQIYLPECFMAISICLALLVSAMFTIRKMFGANSYKCWPYYSIRLQESVEDDLLNNIQEDPSPSKVSLPPNLEPTIEVLLIYPRESEVVEKLMAKFRYILSFYVTKVWDPLDENELEKVSENPSMWIENVLSRDHVKVILVENKHTVEWYETCLHGRPSFHFHHLDNLFLYTVSVLHNDPYLSHNYRKLFIIRFTTLKSNAKSTNIVPCTRYEIPQNFSKLITDLVGSHVYTSKNDSKPPLKEIGELDVMVNEYRKSKRDLFYYEKMGIE